MPVSTPPSKAGPNTPVETGKEKTPSASVKFFKLLLRLAITAVLLVILFQQVKWHEVAGVLARLDNSLLFWICALWIPTQYFQFIKWRLFAREAGDGVTRSDIWRSYWVGFTLGLITPGRIGQLGRAFALRNCSQSRAMGLTVIERGYAALIINSFGLLSLVALPLFGWRPPFALPGHIVQIVCAALGILLLVLGIFPKYIHSPLNRLAKKLPFRDKLEKALSALQWTTPARGLLMLGLSAASLITSLLQFVLIIRAAGDTVLIFPGMMAGALTFFVKGALPITLGSLGVGELSAIYCFQGLGVQPSTAVAASLLLFAINVFIPSLIGLPFVTSLRAPQFRKAEAVQS